MPYISDKKRRNIDGQLVELIDMINAWGKDEGVLNYAITRLLNETLGAGAPGYAHGVVYSDVNKIVGVLECAKMEFYRRIAVPYEDEKISDNGDVY